jgi:hypothetical protein
MILYYSSEMLESDWKILLQQQNITENNTSVVTKYVFFYFSLSFVLFVEQHSWNLLNSVSHLLSLMTYPLTNTIQTTEWQMAQKDAW